MGRGKEIENEFKFKYYAVLGDFFSPGLIIFEKGCECGLHADHYIGRDYQKQRIVSGQGGNALDCVIFRVWSPSLSSRHSLLPRS